MWIFTEWASKWDKQRGKTEGVLSDYVSKNPNQFAIIVATSVHTTMTLGSGIVDLLRLGDGVSEGTWSGTGKDGLRLLGVAGVAGKGLQLAKSYKNTRIADLIADCGGPRCSWMNSTKALAQTGHKTVSNKLFASVDDLLKAMKLKLDDVGGIALTQMVSRLRGIGAQAGSVIEVGSVAQVVKHVKRDGSVVLVSLKGIKNGKEVGGHAVYFYRNSLGSLRIMDRTDIYKNLDDLAKRYNLDEFIPRAISPLRNLYAKYLGPKGGAVLAIEVLGVTSAELGEDK